MKENHTKKFDKESQAYNNVRLERIEAQNDYEDAYYTDKTSKATQILKNVLDASIKKEEEIKKMYAERIFNELSDSKPLLVRRATKELVRWEDAFGKDFSEISPELQGSLIALIELNGGQYRIKT